MKKAIKILAAALAILMITTTAQAQPEGWDDAASEDTPIDGGLSLLLAAGAGYGIKRVSDSRRKG